MLHDRVRGRRAPVTVVMVPVSWKRFFQLWLRERKSATRRQIAPRIRIARFVHGVLNLQVEPAIHDLHDTSRCS
jgi:hypothetical protein